MLKDMDIKNIISIADTEPDFLEIFGETKNLSEDWRNATKFIIEDLMVRASKEVSEIKFSTQTGLKMLSYHQFL